MIGKKVRLVRFNKRRFVYEDGFVETKYPSAMQRG